MVYFFSAIEPENGLETLAIVTDIRIFTDLQMINTG
jgi:hypothetical protein